MVVRTFVWGKKENDGSQVTRARALILTHVVSPSCFPHFPLSLSLCLKKERERTMRQSAAFRVLRVNGSRVTVRARLTRQSASSFARYDRCSRNPRRTELLLTSGSNFRIYPARNVASTSGTFSFFLRLTNSIGGVMVFFFFFLDRSRAAITVFHPEREPRALSLSLRSIDRSRERGTSRAIDKTIDQ